VNIKSLACQIIGPAAAGSAGPVPTALLKTYIDRQRTTSFSENDTRVNINCKYSASNKRENSNTKGMSLLDPPCIDASQFCCSNSYLESKQNTDILIFYNKLRLIL